MLGQSLYTRAFSCLRPTVKGNTILTKARNNKEVIAKGKGELRATPLLLQKGVAS